MKWNLKLFWDILSSKSIYRQGIISSIRDPRDPHIRCEHTNHYTTDEIATTTSPIIKSDGQIWKCSNKNVDI